LLGGGVALRVWQWLGDPSLMIDEAALARSVLQRSWSEQWSLPPFDDQVAPIGFLLVSKAAARMFGPTDLALRCVPTLAGIAALFLAAAVAKRALSAPAATLFTGLVAGGIPFIYWGGAFKPYSGDLAWALALWLFAVSWMPGRTTFRLAAVGAVLGSIGPWMSFAALITLAGVGLALALQHLRSPPPRSTAALGLLLAAWGASAAASLAVHERLVTETGRRYVEQFWSSEFFPGLSGAGAAWLAQCWTGFFGEPGLRWIAPALFAALAAAGLGRLVIRDFSKGVLFVLPFCVALFASALHRYPMHGKLVHFLLPLPLLGLAETAGFLGERLGRRRRALSLAILVAFATPGLGALLQRPPVYRTQEFRPLLEWVAGERRPGDAIYVYYGARQAMSRYQDSVGITAHEYVQGGCHRGDLRAYLEEIDRLRGRARVWVLFSHTYGVLAEKRTLLRYLAQIGSILDERHWPPDAKGSEGRGVHAFLVDLSAPERLGRTSAAEFPLPGDLVVPRQLALGCSGGPARNAPGASPRVAPPAEAPAYL
jgi:hypothetical protein